MTGNLLQHVSGAIHLEQPGEGVIPHLIRFWWVGRELLMYRTVKLNIFLGRFDCKTDHIFMSFDKENFVILAKKARSQVKNESLCRHHTGYFCCYWLTSIIR